MKQSLEIETERERLRRDYEQVTGNSFTHFYCPILLVDEDVELCMGHVINEALPNSCRKRVLQRKDVDNLYGSLVEADFCTAMQGKKPTIEEVLANPKLARVLPVNIHCNHNKIPHYVVKGTHCSSHPVISIPTADDGFIDVALVMSEEELKNVGNLSFEMGRDFVPEAAAMNLKAAHLTMFSILGYQYLETSVGVDTGGILRRFLEKAAATSKKKRRELVADYFEKYAGMILPLVGFNPELLAGSIQDNRFILCKGSSGNFFASVY